jgi:heat shock protein HslJ
MVFAMRTLLVLLLLPIVTACAAPRAPDTGATNGVPDMHNSRNALDWAGVYQGVLPCADCPGIETRVSLQQDGGFERTTRYLDRGEQVFTARGRFEWDAQGRRVLTRADDGETQWYQVGEGRLFHLDREGRRIGGELADRYVLEKNRSDPRLEGRHWVLVELAGQPVEAGPGRAIPSIAFDGGTGRVAGNASCNRFFGGYELLEGDRIRFGQFGATMMACPDMSLEQRFLEVLQRADSYMVNDGVLSLNRARMAPLARFQVKSGD